MTAVERNPYKRAWFWRRVARFDHRRLIFLDESAVNTAMTPTHGRALRGERVVDSAPRNYGEQTSVIAALSLHRGLLAPMTLGGAVDTLAFDAYLVQVLAPCLREEDILVLDNPLITHGREPFKGDRKVLVAMADPFRVADFELRGAELARAAD